MGRSLFHRRKRTLTTETVRQPVPAKPCEDASKLSRSREEAELSGKSGGAVIGVKNGRGITGRLGAAGTKKGLRQTNNPIFFTRCPEYEFVSLQGRLTNS